MPPQATDLPTQAIGMGPQGVEVPPHAADVLKQAIGMPAQAVGVGSQGVGVAFQPIAPAPQGIGLPAQPVGVRPQAAAARAQAFRGWAFNARTPRRSGAREPDGNGARLLPSSEEGRVAAGRRRGGATLARGRRDTTLVEV